jgi:hypothetical protein
MDKLDHPVIYKIRQQNIDRSIQRYVKERKSPYIEIEYDEHHGVVVYHDALRDTSLRATARELLDRFEELHRMRGNERTALFRRLLASQRRSFQNEEAEAQVWRIALLQWTTRHPQPAFENERQSLGMRFIRWLLGHSDHKLVSEYELHLKPVTTRAGLLRLQVELQEDLNFNDNFYEFAPVAVSVALAIVPFGTGARGLALAVEFVGNVFDFLLELHRMQSSGGELDEKEMQEVWWGVLGILPFKLLELLVFGRMIVQVAPLLAKMLYEAVSTFIARLDFMLDARDAGWEGALLADSPHGVFVPDFAIQSEPDEASE